jgi:hypothetical protein
LAFGLRIQSERELPEGVLRAPATDDAAMPDVTIRWAPARGEPYVPGPEGDEPAGWYEFAEGVHRFGWAELGSVEIFSGRDIVVHPLTRVAEGLVEHVLLGPVIADVLLGLGTVPLHASANVVGEGTVAFVGPSGHGKSTLAAALHRAGLSAHADDLLAVPTEGPPLVAFGISRIKLNPDSARQLGDEPSRMPIVYEGIDKRTKVVARQEVPPARPLRAIYRLAEGPALSITRVDPRRALFEIYTNCFRVEVAQHALRAQELLRRCAAVAQRVPLFELRRPKDFSLLPAVVEAVRAHASSL